MVVAPGLEVPGGPESPLECFFRGELTCVQASHSQRLPVSVPQKCPEEAESSEKLSHLGFLLQAFEWKEVFSQFLEKLKIH